MEDKAPLLSQSQNYHFMLHIMFQTENPNFDEVKQATSNNLPIVQKVKEIEKLRLLAITSKDQADGEYALNLTSDRNKVLLQKDYWASEHHMNFTISQKGPDLERLKKVREIASEEQLRIFD